jgi:plastocyanin domain-containing protein
MNSGYSPRLISVKKGIPVKLTLTSNDVYSCALSFILPEFGIKTFLASTDQKTFTFTPTRTGRFNFTCSMGMYTGVLEVKE